MSCKWHQSDALVQACAVVEHANDAWHLSEAMEVGNIVIEVLFIVLFNLNFCQKHFLVVTGVALLLERQTVDVLVRMYGNCC